MAFSYKNLHIVDTGCTLEDLSEAIYDRDGKQERESENSLLATRIDYIYIYIYIYIY